MNFSHKLTSQNELLSRVRILSILFIAFLFLQSSSAFAADGKVYPGSICKRWTSDTIGSEPLAKNRYLGVSQFGFIVNEHPNKRLRVVCPLPREHTTAGIDSITVQGTFTQCFGPQINSGSSTPPRFRINNCGPISDCRFHITNGFGESVASKHIPLNIAEDNSPNSPVVNWPSGKTVRNISVPSLNVGVSFALICSLQPGHRLTRIALVEDASQ